MALTRVPVSMLQPPPVYVDSFNAVGDGVTDDTAAVQAAVNSIGSDGGEVVFTPGKSYKIGSSAVVVSKNNVTFNFNNCQLVSATPGQTAFEIIPQTLVASGREQGTDFPSSWKVSGVPVPYDSDWRTMMFEQTDADRIKNLTVKNCRLDENFTGTLFQAFSVDGVFIYNSNMQPSNASAFRAWHCRNLEYRGNVFGKDGSSSFSLFFFKCQGITLSDNKFFKDGGLCYSIKGVYHGTGSIFDACQAGYVDMGIKISDNVFAMTTATNSFGRNDVGNDPNIDVMTLAGGSPIGFTRLQWVGNGIKNLVVTDNVYSLDVTAGFKRVGIHNVIIPSQEVVLSRNKSYGGVFFVAGGEGIYIEDNILDFDPTDTASDTAPIAVRKDSTITTQGLPNTGGIRRNTIKNCAGDVSAEDKQVIRLVAAGFDVSNNRVEYPLAGVTLFLRIDSADSDYITGNGNVVLVGSNSVVDTTDPVSTMVGGNANGGTVFCGIVDTVTQNSAGVFKAVGFGDQLGVEGLTTAGTVTLNNRSGFYTLINNLCFFQIRVNWTSLTGTGDLAITGLPYVVDDGESANYRVTFNISADNLTFSNQLIAYALPGEDFIRLATISSAAAMAAVPVDAGADVYITGYYPYKI